jgi:hypothetical protein
MADGGRRKKIWLAVFSTASHIFFHDEQNMRVTDANFAVRRPPSAVRRPPSILTDET